MPLSMQQMKSGSFLSILERDKLLFQYSKELLLSFVFICNCHLIIIIIIFNKKKKNTFMFLYSSQK